ncbi:MAG: enoyl-CoA hydratase/isomerase family protein [Actinobacteria bacterium]|nr:enoyl-CoA hydratase/isomerase family protein [Actinomycetota bacterium]
MELTAVRYEVEGHVATVWLHRPHRHNAWTGRMHGEYRRVLATLHADPSVRVIVVTGTPPAFCVGGDSEALAGHAERGGYDPGLVDDLPTPGYGLRPEFDADFAFQFALRTPLIAAVNGAAAGVGLALALFCDLRFGCATAKLTTAAPKLGLPAEYGMSWQLPRLVGATRAADLLLSGRVVTPADTAEWGLWNGVEDTPDATLAAAQRYAQHLATGVGPTALATTKAQLYADLLQPSPAASIHEAQRLLAEAMTTAEYREGVAALREKRPPNFG